MFSHQGNLAGQTPFPNFHCHWFCSWQPDPEVEVPDTITQNWAERRGFANAPWCLINHCLCQVTYHQVGNVDNSVVEDPVMASSCSGNAGG